MPLLRLSMIGDSRVKIQADSKVSLVLILMASASLVSMLATLRIDNIVHHDLYGYGLQFNTEWAVPYWRTAAVVFSMGWLIILMSIAFELRLLLLRLHRSPEPEIPTSHQEPLQNEVLGIPCEIRVPARNNGTTPLTITEVWIRNLELTSVSPALPCTIQPNGKTVFVISTSASSECSYQVRMVSARGNAYISTATARPREMPEQAEPNGEPVEKQMIATSFSVKKNENDLSGFRVLPEEKSVMTNTKAERQEAEDKPRSSQ